MSTGGGSGACIAAVCLMSVAGPSAAAALQAQPGGDGSADLVAGDAGDRSGLGLLPGRPTVRPPRTDTPPEIDGRLDDDVWERAAKLTEFTQESPLEGAPASEDTEVYIAYDDDNIYFGGSSHKCVHDSAPAGRPRRGKRVRMRSCQLTSGEVVCRSVDGRLRGPRF